MAITHQTSLLLKKLICISLNFVKKSMPPQKNWRTLLGKNSPKKLDRRLHNSSLRRINNLLDPNASSQ